MILPEPAEEDVKIREPKQVQAPQPAPVVAPVAAPIPEPEPIVEPEPIEEPIYVFDCQMVCESGIPGFEGSVPFYRFTVETELDPGQVYAYVPAVKPN